MAHNGKNKRRIKYRKIFKYLLVLVIFVIFLLVMANTDITNIYVVGNSVLSDQEIIDASGLRDYPKIYKVSGKKIISKLEDNPYIRNVSVSRSNLFRTVTLKIEENKPLVYYAYDETFLLSDGTSVKDGGSLPTLINQTPDDILQKLLQKLAQLSDDILIRISEIQYAPTDVDEELFHLVMIDGNDVYINFNSFSNLNDYVDMVQKIDGAKGTLHLDSGNYLEKYDD